mmetsp:Transcript_45116/g.106283  ORF Transcript_45116/g.106283 Transcript_45116/m.106283 type:complete len:294 (+) Transcript_45116:247-1128(+)
MVEVRQHWNLLMVGQGAVARVLYRKIALDLMQLRLPVVVDHVGRRHECHLFKEAVRVVFRRSDDPVCEDVVDARDVERVREPQVLHGHRRRPQRAHLDAAAVGISVEFEEDVWALVVHHLRHLQVRHPLHPEPFVAAVGDVHQNLRVIVAFAHETEDFEARLVDQLEHALHQLPHRAAVEVSRENGDADLVRPRPKIRLPWEQQWARGVDGSHHTMRARPRHRTHLLGGERIGQRENRPQPPCLALVDAFADADKLALVVSPVADPPKEMHQREKRRVMVGSQLHSLGKALHR